MTAIPDTSSRLRPGRGARLATSLVAALALCVTTLTQAAVDDAARALLPDDLKQKGTLVAAMHLGKAIVITDSSGVSDYVRNGDNGLTVAAGSVESLATATRCLWDDPVLRARLAENGQRFARTECTEERIADHFRGWLRSQGFPTMPQQTGSQVPG